MPFTPVRMRVENISSAMDGALDRTIIAMSPSLSPIEYGPWSCPDAKTLFVLGVGVDPERLERPIEITAVPEPRLVILGADLQFEDDARLVLADGVFQCAHDHLRLLLPWHSSLLPFSRLANAL